MCRPVANYQEWCREIAGVHAGELSVTAMRSVVRRYSDAFFTTAARKRAGEPARYPRRRRRLFPVRWYHETFALDGRRLRLSTARGGPELWVRLARDIPYPARKRPDAANAAAAAGANCRVTQRQVEARHRRRVHQAHHEAAENVIDWAIERRVGTLVVGDPQGITHAGTGKKQNWRLHAWRRTH